MFKPVICTVLLSILHTMIWGQSVNHELKINLKGIVASEAAIDHLNQLYLIVDNATVLKKLDIHGKTRYSFNDYRYGEISKIDITNPFKILVYYQDFETILVLDNTLSIVEEISLPEFGFYDVSILCMSNDNHIWIFNSTTNQLDKINEQGVSVVSSNDLQFDLGYVPELVNIIEKNNQLYALDKKGDVHIFNLHGRFLKTIKLNAQKIFPFANQLFLVKHNYDFMFYDPFDLASKPYTIPEKLNAERSLFFGQNYLLYWDKDGLRAYKSD